MIVRRGEGIADWRGNDDRGRGDLTDVGDDSVRSEDDLHFPEDGLLFPKDELVFPEDELSAPRRTALL